MYRFANRLELDHELLRRVVFLSRVKVSSQYGSLVKRSRLHLGSQARAVAGSHPDPVQTA